MKRASKALLTVPATVVLALVLANTALAQPDLTIASWGGAYARSQMLAYIRPFREQTGSWVAMEDYSGGLDQIREQVESINVTWDVVDLHMEDVLAGCEEGLLEKIDHSILEPSPTGIPARRDFLPDMLPECGVGIMVFSTVMAYAADRFTNRPPRRLTDFFNLSRYPGKRGLRRSPKGALEWALLADGVPHDRIYTTLSRENGMRRAFAKLNTIKRHILWWERGSEPAQMLAEGAVVMTSAWHGRIHQSNQRKGENLVIVWDNQLWEYHLLGVLKGTERLEAALALIRFATTTDRLAAQARHIAHGPARRSAMALVGEDVRPYLPNALQNTERFLRIDNAWWARNLQKTMRRFNAWLPRR